MYDSPNMCPYCFGLTDQTFCNMGGVNSRKRRSLGPTLQAATPALRIDWPPLPTLHIRKLPGRHENMDDATVQGT